MSTYALTNANTGEVEQTFDSLTPDQIPGIIEHAHKAHLEWKTTPYAKRAEVLNKYASLLDEKQDELADIIGREMGKPLPQGKAELAKVARTARWYAAHSEQFLVPTELPATGAERTYVRHDPLGVLFGVMPWNFPYNQLARFTMPNLMVGNSILMKQASICPVSSQKFQELLEEAGLPSGVYTNIYLNTEDAEQVLKDFRVKGFSVTGSEGAGAAIAGIAGKNLKRGVLELGGNDPFVVLDTDDVKALAQQAVTYRTTNAGQVCTSPKRFIVVEELYDEFVAAAKEAIEAVKVGDYNDPEINMGPLSSESARDDILEALEQAKKDGATLVTGGEKLERLGWFMRPALLTDVDIDSDTGRHEIFGPVMIIFKAKDEEDALRLANHTEYGLMASVWTTDLDKGRHFAERINAGMTFVNKHMESEPNFPFGGINKSGFGRENAQWGLREFTNEHLVRVHQQ
ncbi:NAD-dependent succinate-semialdehyde dehydrogenase [Rothia sp. ZJ1223]|uniref:NAD-dependent succinate-semialdehyde dehydrogenase n=1 Tax=Rothia sp. ZJ1223 TaxID=2811098 RepID=UPI00195B8561|nr:NAD-dependent succinate-semialdehyde dehydrogenase [Rothia sp. ZJ1223]MBM7052118.1 NAD-dependent succinate-semialdehyde dehydrogenase [Rothia sp. ZJ1223]